MVQKGPDYGGIVIGICSRKEFNPRDAKVNETTFLGERGLGLGEDDIGLLCTDVVTTMIEETGEIYPDIPREEYAGFERVANIVGYIMRNNPGRHGLGF